MRGIAGGEALPGDSFGTDTLNNLPPLTVRRGEIDDVGALRFAGEGTTVENNHLSWIFLPGRSGSLEQHIDDVVILRGGVLDLVRGEESVTGGVFAQENGVENADEGLRDVRLSGARQACHDDQHAFIMTSCLHATTAGEP